VGALIMTDRTKVDATAPAEKSVPTDAERAEVQTCTERKKRRRRSPRFTVERQEDAQVYVAPAGVHPEVAIFRVMNAFGTTNADLAECLIRQILNTTHLQSSGAPINADTLNAALAAVTGIGPQDEAEAMLATQMVAVHWVAMALLGKAGLTNDRTLLNDAGNLAVKLLRTYTTQLETLKRYRSAGEQRVVVQHQHVNVTADQAAVQVNGGGYPAPEGRGAASKPEERSHEQRLAHAPEPAMRGPEPARDAVPVTGCDGAGSLSAPRRG
jgi:hypothetical protein